MHPFRLFLPLALSLLLSLSASAPAHAATPARPNIVFILADDLGYMDIGANNPNTFYETPNIDALAKRGMRFTQGYSACCVCSPTRGSIMTGKYPPRFGITDFIPGMRPGKLLSAPNATHLPLAETTLAEAMRDGGYATFFAGKWHLGAGEFFPGAQGFPSDLAGTGQFFYPPSATPPPDPKDDPKTTDRIADAAVAFIAAHKEKPFFAYLPFLAPHNPIGARSDLVAKYEKKKLSALPDAWGRERARDVRLVQNHAGYAAMLEQLDTALGRVFAALEKNGLTGKGWPYEGGTRVAWLVSAPGITKPGTTCDTPVISTDYYPTLLQLAGLPAKPEQHRDGVSLLPQLKGERTSRGKPLYWHYPHYGNQGGAPHGAIRDGDWKFIEWFEDGAVELYNIPQDISEKTNLAAQHPEKVAALRAKLIAWRTEVGAVMPTPNPNYDPNAKPEPAAAKKNAKKNATKS